MMISTLCYLDRYAGGPVYRDHSGQLYACAMYIGTWPLAVLHLSTTPFEGCRALDLEYTSGWLRGGTIDGRNVGFYVALDRQLESLKTESVYWKAEEATVSVNVRKLRGKFRIVEAGTRKLARSKNDVPMDGGGHEDREKAVRQAGHINTSPRREDS